VIRVGTSGWHYADWRGAFYPSHGASQRWLELYAREFATVEINATFYRLTAASVLRSWHDAVPDDFVFAVKASRYLTHVRRLGDPRGPVELLLERTGALGSKRGPVLLQLPPNMAVDVDRLGETLEAFAGAADVAVEVRHPSWDRAEVRSLLERYHAALVLTDRRGPARPVWATAPWGYVRFHAGRAQPTPCYGSRALRTWAGRVGDLWAPGADVFAYFNNDQGGCAPRDGRLFGLACARRGLEVTRVPGPGVARLSARPDG
jgi:uncharacterized protein YecE (DUF72 family)